LKQKVIVTDISNDIRWAAYTEIANKYQLRSCWSYPIMGANDNVMATFACYYGEVRTPSALEEHTIQRAGNILQIILENYQREQALKISNERFEHAIKAASDIIWDWNLETNEVYYSDNMKHLFGHKSGYTNDNLPFYFAHVHPDDRERVMLYPDQVKYGTMTNWTQEYRFKKADGEYAFVLDRGIVIRDEKGTGIRMIGAMQDITLIKQHELRVTQQNERLMEIALINAHEIRRPVATILGLMQLFNQTVIKSETERELLTHLDSATKELDNVIRRIIDKTVD
jgi:PAS domain S-box-containing protein